MLREKIARGQVTGRGRQHSYDCRDMKTIADDLRSGTQDLVLPSGRKKTLEVRFSFPRLCSLMTTYQITNHMFQKSKMIPNLFFDEIFQKNKGRHRE